METTEPKNIPPDDDDFDEAAFDRMERLTAYLDDELPPEERAALERDLEQDDTLRAELEDLRGTLQALHNLGAPRAPEAFVKAVETRIRVRSRGRFFDEDPLYRSRVPYELFAALMLVMLGALLYYSDPNKKDLDFAMAGREEPPAEEPPQEAAQPGSAPVVTPARSEAIRYVITLEDAAPAQRADALEDLLRRSGATLSPRGERPDAQVITAELPDGAVEGFLKELKDIQAIKREATEGPTQVVLEVRRP